MDNDLVSNDHLLVINYWDNDEAKEGEDISISIYQFAADYYYCEDLNFV